MLQLLDVAPGLSSVLWGWSWKHAQHLEDGNWRMTARNVSIWGRTRLKNSSANFRSPCFGACWIGALFQPRKMTGILCANWVQMWDWISQITQFLSCLHVEFHSQTVSNFQIASYSFKEVAKPCLLPVWWEGTVFGKERLCCPCSVPAVGKRAWSRAHGSFCAGCALPAPPGLHHSGCPHVHMGLSRGPSGAICSLVCIAWLVVLWTWKDEAQPCFLKTDWPVAIFWVCFFSYRDWGKVLVSTSKAYHLSHGGLHYSSMSYIEYIFVVCNG